MSVFLRDAGDFGLGWVNVFRCNCDLDHYVWLHAQVHQACYGVPKIPKGPWMCRTCKFKVAHPASPVSVLIMGGIGCFTADTFFSFS